MLPTAGQAPEFEYTIGSGAVTITRYTGPGGEVILPQTVAGLPVARIGDRAFSGLSNLTTIAIPDSVTYIHSTPWSSAFEGCTGLTRFEVAMLNPAFSSLDGVLFNKNQTTLIAFPGGKTGHYVIPEIVTDIGYGAFAGCTGLSSVTIGKGVTHIWYRAFWGCAALTNIDIPAGVTFIAGGGGEQDGGPWGAFADCTSLTNVAIPDTVDSIGAFAFWNCTSLTSIAIPDAVTTIKGSTFAGCTSLTSIVIPASVTTIDHSAFSGCMALKDITIPEGVTSILYRAFSDCTSLTSIVIPDTVTTIEYGAFSDCSGLTSVTIGKSVTSIEPYAFSHCSSLTAVYYAGNAFGGLNSFMGSPVTIYHLPGTSGWDTGFYDHPTALWLPRVEPAGIQLGGGRNEFALSIHWARGKTVGVESATNPTNPVWMPLATIPLTDSSATLSDPDSSSDPMRFYRAVEVTPSP
ncbi:MAG: leucine-rich repeat domain-containing protein [Verrucomicrobiales bacterium]|nr:leucine-rich repeat domain-containing protein [Verrucomicrobiales bacterium]